MGYKQATKTFLFSHVNSLELGEKLARSVEFPELAKLNQIAIVTMNFLLI